MYLLEFRVQIYLHLGKCTIHFSLVEGDQWYRDDFISLIIQVIVIDKLRKRLDRYFCNYQQVEPDSIASIFLCN